jgi:hypothetical protein
MSAGFKVKDEVFWGTNGAVEAYVETMASLAIARFGPHDPFAAYLAEQRDSFSTGRVLFLDEWLADEAGRERFAALLDAATERLLREGLFSEYGREWVASVVVALRARILTSGSSESGIAPGPHRSQ